MLLAEDSSTCARSVGIEEGFLHQPLAVVERAAHRQAGDVVAPAGELLLLRRRDQPLRKQHHHLDAGPAMERRRDRAARVARSGHQDAQRPRRAARGMRARLAARKRAPKSLNAAVGPWNSSSTSQRSGLADTARSGAGKLKASRGDRRELPARARSPAAKRADQLRAQLRQRSPARARRQLRAIAPARTARHPAPVPAAALR